MRTRNHDWLNLDTREISYGIQVKTPEGWLNAAENGKPLLFSTPQERDTKRKEIRAKR